MKTFLFHDYETYGIHTKKTRVSQFAAIRTDENLNIIEGQSFDFLCAPPIDFIPSIDACLVTGITPHNVRNLESHYNDYQIFKKIHALFNVKGTCSIGYNSQNFDDEISRNGFYRNLLPAYTREFKDDCSRFDVINVLREFAFLYPNDIKIPTDEEGKIIFKLDQLAPLNGFKESTYHNAFTDVKATIFMAKLMKEKRPEFWDLKINNYMKKNVTDYIRNNRSDFFIHTTPYYGSDNGYVKPLQEALMLYPDNNSMVMVDLSNYDAIKRLIETPADQLKKEIYMTKDEMEENGLSKSALIKFAVNKLPVLTSVNDFDRLNVENKGRLNIDQVKKNQAFFLSNRDIIVEKIKAVFKPEEFNNTSKNPDLKIYDGFMSRTDEYHAANFHIDMINKNYAKYITSNVFEAEKNNQIARNIIFRNFSDDIIQSPELSPYLLQFLVKSYKMVKDEGFDPTITYSEEEKALPYKNNDRMIEFTLSELREIIPNLEKEHSENPEKLKVISDFKMSLNETMKLFKENIEKIQHGKNVEKNPKKPSRLSP